MKPRLVEQPKQSDMRAVMPTRQANSAYRVREHLTEDEVAKLLAALKHNRHGARDWLIGLLIYRHGLRVSEACDLRWNDLDLPKRTMIVRRLKGSHDSTHYLERDELADKCPAALVQCLHGWAESHPRSQACAAGLFIAEPLPAAALARASQASAGWQHAPARRPMSPFEPRAH
jgi:integrase